MNEVSWWQQTEKKIENPLKVFATNNNEKKRKKVFAHRVCVRV